ncbi:hypothetical protein PG593_03270 [Riemerella anatipestifer]|nr:hypothetical protein [Riemerella anatipestifer]
MKYKFLIICLLFFFTKLFATGQTPNKIIIDDKEYDLLTNPIESYFAKNREVDPIYEGKIKMFDRYKTELIPIPFSTGNYRGYIATFKIENQILKLVDIEIQNIESEKREYISVYKDLFGDNQVHLGYSGILVVPIGDFLDSANFGYSYLYSKYKLITIKNDQVQRSKELTKDEFLRFKSAQFEEFKKTPNYTTLMMEYYDTWNADKEFELSRENRKNLTRKEILELKEKYSNPPKKEIVENFIFLTKNIDFIIVDY